MKKSQRKIRVKVLSMNFPIGINLCGDQRIERRKGVDYLVQRTAPAVNPGAKIADCLEEDALRLAGEYPRGTHINYSIANERVIDIRIKTIADERPKYRLNLQTGRVRL